MFTLHLAVNVLVLISWLRPRDWLPARLVFYFLTLAPRDHVTYYQARRLAVGVWPQDMGCAPRGGLAHKVKACTALLGVHRKTLYSTK